MFNFKSDLNAILAVFTKAIKALENHAATKAEETVQHTVDAAESTALAQSAAAEQAKAMSIVAKLKALL